MVNPNIPPELPVDPSDPVSIQKKLEEIYDENGPLAHEANGDGNYLRFLQEDAVAQLAVLANPGGEEVRERATKTHEALETYVMHKFGHP